MPNPVCRLLPLLLLFDRSPRWYVNISTHRQDMFYEKADALVGICRDHATNSSRTLTLDLEAIDNV